MKGPKTIDDYEKILNTVYELMANPYCDVFMFDNLVRKRDALQNKIENLSLPTVQQVD